jgi:glycosyltransferase involved in cell wall biosynthesis
MTESTTAPPWTAPDNDYRGIVDLDPVARPALGVVIPTYNRSALLARTLAGLVAQTLPPDRFAVVVADDGSDEDLGAIVRRYDDRLDVGLVRQDRHGFGAGRARGLGARTVAGDVLVFLDSDCIPHPGLLERHAFWHARASNVVVVGTRRAIDSSPFDEEMIASRHADLLAAADGVDDRGEVVPDDWRAVFYRRTRQMVVGDAVFRSGTSANLSIHRRPFEAAGGFPDDFHHWGGEDTTLTWNAWNDGAFVVPDKRAIVFHQTQLDSEAADDARMEARRTGLSLVADRIPHRFYRKAPTPFASVPLVSWIVQAETPDEVDRAWREASASGFGDAEIIIVGPATAVAHMHPLGASNPSVHVIDARDRAIATAVRIARGAYVAFFDARSRFDRGLLNKAVDRIEDDPRSVAVRFAYRIGDERYRRLDDLAALDASLGRNGLPLFTVVRRRELMKDTAALDMPGEAWATVLDRAPRLDLVIGDSVALETEAPRPADRPGPRDLAAAGLREVARAAVKQARALRDRSPAPEPAAPDSRIPVDYVGLTGKQNLGDDAVRVAIERLMPWAHFAVDHPDPRLLMVGGGTLINGRRYYLTRMLRRDSPAVERVLFGTGVRSPEYWGVTEPMDDWFGFIDSAIVAGVRGPDSVANLRTLGYDRSLPIIGDPALTLDAPEGTERIDGRVVVCPVWTSGNLHGGDDGAVFDAMASTIGRLRATGREVVMLSAFPEDDRWIIELMRRAEAADMPYVAGYADLDASLALLASADLVIGERLHAAILAAAVATPFVALEYRPKVRDFTRSIDQEDATVRTDEIDRLDEVVDAILEDVAGAAAALAEPVAHFRALQARTSDEIRRALED